jgi:hypothetical protein
MPQSSAVRPTNGLFTPRDGVAIDTTVVVLTLNRNGRIRES